ncbi:MAG: 16S rRNA pseudouridine(516) synthase [Firmicutes bacterium HGW-Firmicutes-16]|nr:MAG: 16S rRNA pseudouridine(516) synthase [Firmicutes bacterium HGW-Firmicutes-16]
MSLTRLDKIISDSGFATRSEARIFIAASRVRIDREVVLDAALKVDLERVEVSLDGKAISSGFRYFMLNKPEGILSATEDRDQKTVLDLLPHEFAKLGLFPVGRLDKDTTGLLILTNDGDFGHFVTSPKHHIKKLYEFSVEGLLENDDIKAFESGIVLQDGTICLPAVLEIDERDFSHGFVTIYEGKYHQVKRMLASRGKYVRMLKRIAIGSLSLDASLHEGEYKELTENDLNLIVNRNVTK